MSKYVRILFKICILSRTLLSKIMILKFFWQFLVGHTVYSPGKTYPTLADMKVIGFAMKSRKILSIFRKSQTLLLAMKLHFQFLHLHIYTSLNLNQIQMKIHSIIFLKNLDAKDDIRSRRYNRLSNFLLFVICNIGHQNSIQKCAKSLFLT